MSEPYRICLIDDDPSARTSIERVLVAEGYEVAGYPDGSAGLTAALAMDFDCVLTDLRMPGVSGFELIDRLREELPNLPVVLMTAHGTTDIAIEATRRGAFEYIVKPFEIEELLAMLARAAEAGRRRRTKISLGQERRQAAALVGRSRAMQAVYKEIGRVAGKPVPVLLLGETGTGKELVARALWQHGDRRAKSFVAVNCAAIPPSLLESELFGHERGAFTGANERRIGRFEQAQGGTLFLDEIGDLTVETQAKLLRVLQERVVSRVGGREPIPVDIRLIAATHRNLPALVANGKFRDDLWYRLNVVTIRLPPLRERRDDIPELVAYFIARHGADLGGAAEVQPDALQLLSSRPWPGNVRELENVIRRVLLMAHGYTITAELVHQALAAGPTLDLSPDASDGTIAALCQRALDRAHRGEDPGAALSVLTVVERELLAQAHAASGGNITRMARLLGWSRLTVREKLKFYGLRSAARDNSGHE